MVHSTLWVHITLARIFLLMVQGSPHPPPHTHTAPASQSYVTIFGASIGYINYSSLFTVPRNLCLHICASVNEQLNV